MYAGWIHRAAAVGFACLAIAAPAAAMTEVEGDTARFTWTPGTGPVGFYLVYVSRNGGQLMVEAGRLAGEPWADLSGNPGDEIEVRVLALLALSGTAQSTSPLSDVSEIVRFVEPTDTTPPDIPDVPPPVTTPALPKDFDGDGDTDLLFRNADTGALRIWLLDGTAIDEVDDPGTLLAGQRIVGNSDYDGDGYADLLLHDASRDELEIRYLVGGHLAEATTIDLAAGSRVVASADFADEGRANILIHDPATGHLDRLNAEGEITPQRPIPIGATPVAGLDLRDDGTPELLYRSAGAVIAHALTGAAANDVLTGYIFSSLTRFPAACSLPGPGQDAVLTSNVFSSHHRTGFAQPTLVLTSAAIYNASSTLLRSPIIGAGDFDADGSCDLAVEASGGALWLLLLDGNQVHFGWQIDPPGGSWVPDGVGAESPLASP